MYNKEKNTVTCDYCLHPAKLVMGSLIYPHRSDLSDKRFWYCEPCGAYVGVHENSQRNAPLGRLADAELRKMKSETHLVFDPLWRRLMELHGFSKSRARKEAYKWLAKKLDIKIGKCHVGMFDIDTCCLAIEICSDRNAIMEIGYVDIDTSSK